MSLRILKTTGNPVPPPRATTLNLLETAIDEPLKLLALFKDFCLYEDLLTFLVFLLKC